MRVVVLNGYPLSGKDTFANLCIRNLSVLGKGIGYNISTVELIKKLAMWLGWDGIKTDKDRKFLSDFKKLLKDWNDIPYTYVVKTMRNIQADYLKYKIPENQIVFFVHTREPEEIKRFQEELGAITVLIKRDDVDLEFSNDSDKNVNEFNYDYVIENNEGLEKLEKKAINFLKELNL